MDEASKLREQGAAFVFVGGMLLWCVRHYDRRRPVHLGMLVFTALLAAIHWQGYFESGGYAGPALANTVPFVLFALTTPLSGGHSPTSRREND